MLIHIAPGVIFVRLIYVLRILVYLVCICFPAFVYNMPQRTSHPCCCFVIFFCFVFCNPPILSPLTPTWPHCYVEDKYNYFFEGSEPFSFSTVITHGIHSSRLTFCVVVKKRVFAFFSAETDWFGSGLSHRDTSWCMFKSGVKNFTPPPPPIPPSLVELKKPFEIFVEIQFTQVPRRNPNVETNLLSGPARLQHDKGRAFYDSDAFLVS